MWYVVCKLMKIKLKSVHPSFLLGLNHKFARTHQVKHLLLSLLLYVLNWSRTYLNPVHEEPTRIKLIETTSWLTFWRSLKDKWTEVFLVCHGSLRLFHWTERNVPNLIINILLGCLTMKLLILYYPVLKDGHMVTFVLLGYHQLLLLVAELNIFVRNVPVNFYDVLLVLVDGWYQLSFNLSCMLTNLISAEVTGLFLGNKVCIVEEVPIKIDIS